jgi:hypothetical protein
VRVEGARQQRDHDSLFRGAQFDQHSPRLVRMPAPLEQAVASGTVLPAVDADLRPLPGLIGDAGVHREVAVEIDPLDPQSLPQSCHVHLHQRPRLSKPNRGVEGACATCHGPARSHGAARPHVASVLSFPAETDQTARPLSSSSRRSRGARLTAAPGNVPPCPAPSGIRLWHVLAPCGIMEPVPAKDPDRTDGDEWDRLSRMRVAHRPRLRSADAILQQQLEGGLVSLSEPDGYGKAATMNADHTPNAFGARSLCALVRSRHRAARPCLRRPAGENGRRPVTARTPVRPP